MTNKHVVFRFKCLVGDFARWQKFGKLVSCLAMMALLSATIGKGTSQAGDAAGLPGDVTGDGQVTWVDLQKIREHLEGGRSVEAERLALLDLNEDGIGDIADLFGVFPNFSDPVLAGRVISLDESSEISLVAITTMGVVLEIIPGGDPDIREGDLLLSSGSGGVGFLLEVLSIRQDMDQLSVTTRPVGPSNLISSGHVISDLGTLEIGETAISNRQFGNTNIQVRVSGTFSSTIDKINSTWGVEENDLKSLRSILEGIWNADMNIDIEVLAPDIHSFRLPLASLSPVTEPSESLIGDVPVFQSASGIIYLDVEVEADTTGTLNLRMLAQDVFARVGQDYLLGEWRDVSFSNSKVEGQLLDWSQNGSLRVKVAMGPEVDAQLYGNTSQTFIFGSVLTFNGVSSELEGCQGALDSSIATGFQTDPFMAG